MSRVMLVVVLMFLGYAVPVPAQEISDEEILAHLKERLAALNNKEVVFRSWYHYPNAGLRFQYVMGSGELPGIAEGRPTEPPDVLKDDLLSTVGHHRVAFSNGKIRTERLAEVDPRNEGERVVRTWDGIEARSKGYDPDGEGTALRITTEPDSGFFLERYWTWLGTWLYGSSDMTLTPAALFQSASEKERRVEGEVTIWTFDPPMASGREIEIRAVRDPTVRIISITQQSYRRDENRNRTSMLSSEMRIEFERNEPGDDLLLPRRARLTMARYNPEGAIRIWGVDTFELESIEPLGELPDDFFRLSAENETVLHIPDSRPMIAEMLAEREGSVDEKRVDPVDLVERREQESVAAEPRAEASSPSRTSSPPAALWWIAGGMISAGVIGVVVVIVRRMRT